MTGRATKNKRTMDFVVNSIADYDTIAIALEKQGWKVEIL